MSNLIEIGAAIMTYVGGIWAIVQIFQLLSQKVSLQTLINHAKFAASVGFWLLLSLVSLGILTAVFAGLSGRIFVTLSFLVALAMTVLVHVSVMALTGSALGQKIETLSYGIGPVLWSRTTSGGAEINISLLFFMGGYVKFQSLSLGAGALINFLAPTSLLIVSSALIGFGTAISTALFSVEELLNGLRSLSLQSATSELYLHIENSPFLNTLATMFAGVAAINLLPIPIFNGGHIVINTVQIIFGSKLSDRSLRLFMTTGITITVYGVALFLIAVII